MKTSTTVETVQTTKRNRKSIRPGQAPSFTDVLATPPPVQASNLPPAGQASQAPQAPRITGKSPVPVSAVTLTESDVMLCYKEQSALVAAGKRFGATRAALNAKLALPPKTPLPADVFGWLKACDRLATVRSLPETAFNAKHSRKPVFAAPNGKSELFAKETLSALDEVKPCEAPLLCLAEIQGDKGLRARLEKACNQPKPVDAGEARKLANRIDKLNAKLKAFAAIAGVEPGAEITGWLASERAEKARLVPTADDLAKAKAEADKRDAAKVEAAKAKAERKAAKNAAEQAENPQANPLGSV